ncbi:RICIN domain-containing protein [Streptomyces sp. NPDC006984]|uniref:RICIN domain-containing protein n=1 Tax=Streptomyces sp. NPDC006984 TaxID=3155463 RepID=UPI0033C6BD02
MSSDGRCLAEYDAGVFTTASPSECGAPSTNGGKLSYSWSYSGTGTFRIVSTSTGRCLTSKGFSQAVPAACDGSAAQSWRIGSGTSGSHTLRSAADGGCLTMSGATVVSYTCNGSASQLWRKG